MEMSEEQIKAMVVTNIIDNCTIGLDNTGQVRYSLNEQQFGKCLDALVKSIKAIQSCKSDSEQLMGKEEETTFDLWLKNFKKAGEDLYWYNEHTLYCVEAMRYIYKNKY